MSSSPRPITWVSPLGRVRFGTSAFSGEDTARSWISLCCLVAGIAADDMLGRRAEGSREGRLRAFGIDQGTVAVESLSTLTRNRGHPLRPPRRPDNTVRIGMKQRWRGGGNERA